MRLHTSGKASLIKFLERSSGRGRTRRCPLENILQIVVVVKVEPADGQELLGAFELATNDAVCPTRVGPQGQSTVGPELPLGAKTVRCLDQRKQQNRADGTDHGNLLQQSHVQVLAALR